MDNGAVAGDGLGGDLDFEGGTGSCCFTEGEEVFEDDVAFLADVVNRPNIMLLLYFHPHILNPQTSRPLLPLPLSLYLLPILIQQRKYLLFPPPHRKHHIYTLIAILAVKQDYAAA